MGVSGLSDRKAGFWSNKRVLVTGGTGFIGSFLVEMLLTEGAEVRVSTRSKKTAGRFLKENLQSIELVEVDLLVQEAAGECVSDMDIVLQLAAAVGGLEYNINRPASTFRDNIRLALNILEAVRLNGRVERTLITSSACVYPRHCSIPTPEEEGFKDSPEPTNEGYGWAKRMQEYAASAYTKEYGLKTAIARPYNCYGPRDNFDPKSSHVIPALIRRIWRDKERPLKVWGSGNQSRSFLYVKDFARGLMDVTEHFAVAEAVNLGADEETSIKELVSTLQEIYIEMGGEKFDIVFDTTQPEGQPRRRCDVRKAKEEFNFSTQWDLKRGLKETVEWYIKSGMP